MPALDPGSRRRRARRGPVTRALVVDCVQRAQTRLGAVPIPPPPPRTSDAVAAVDVRHELQAPQVQQVVTPTVLQLRRICRGPSVRHARPITIGLNCALGAALMRPYIAELAKICDTYVCVYPNAGLPNPMSDTGFDETPADTSALLEEFARAGLVNMAGGCCGNTPEHVAAIARAVAGIPPRFVPVVG